MPTEIGRFSATGEKTGFHGVDIQNILRGEFSRTDPELRSLYTYDAQGNLVEASENGTDYHYTHDTEGRVLSKRAWGKTLYENHYDACGRLRELITGEQKTSYGYDKAGRLAEVCASNSIRAQYQYDRNDMQTDLTPIVEKIALAIENYGLPYFESCNSYEKFERQLYSGNEHIVYNLIFKFE